MREPLRHARTEVFLHAVRQVPVSIAAVLAAAGVSGDEVAAYLAPPRVARPIRQLRGVLGVDEKRCPFAAAEYGNTVSSSIPLMLLDPVEGPGPLLLSGFGVGFSWGTCLLDPVED